MYIKEITIEGFKSYAQSTVISTFDPHFNAITGLNGSGKSNILDSICFVLGITNLNQVRATHLQELIYKGGNAGITKATVSITFDNSEKEHSPAGYLDYEEILITRQISVGGKHKYLINGQNATAQRVTDLFCSVQLNVNNPNFLIMQGKITKVLNMKPIEILSMIEEAAGTKTYDIKKANSLLTIDKKNAKLNEIERVLREDITPIIEKLKQERSAYIEYQKCEREYLHLHKISLAYEYHQNELNLTKLNNESNDLETNLTNNKTRIEFIDTQIDLFRKEIKTLKENVKDKLLDELELKLKEIKLDLTKLNSEAKNLNTNMNSEEKKIKQIEKQIDENRNLIETKQIKLNEMKTLADSSKEMYEKAESELKNAQQLYEQLCCGGIQIESTQQEQQQQARSIHDQLIDLANRISSTRTQLKQIEIKMNNCLTEKTKLNVDLNASKMEYDARLNDLNQINKIIDSLNVDMTRLNYNPANYENLINRRRETNQQINNSNNNIQTFYAKYPQLSSNYKIRRENFDQSKIKGLVCTLFKVKDLRFATALEIAAGAKLFNLVVDSDQTGKLLLESGELKRKVTIIPMNQIRSNTIGERVLRTAADLVGNENVFSALSLIDYDPVYRPVMEYVFGTKLICTTMDSAKRVAFHPQIMTNAITLDGDHFDPEGILTGGSKLERGNLLIKLVEFSNDMNNLNNLNKNLEDIEIDINKEKLKLSSFSKLKRDIDEQTSKLNSIKTSLEQTSYYQKLEKLKLLDKQIEQSKLDLVNLNKDLEENKLKQEELTNKRDNFNKDEEKLNAQKTIENRKAFIENHLKKNSKFEQEYESIKLEINVLNNEISSYNEEISKIKENLNDLNKQLDSLKDKTKEIQEEENKITASIDERKSLIEEKNVNINKKLSECDKLEKEKNALELNNKELNHKKSSMNDQLKHSNNRILALVESNDWINEEKNLFGMANTIYDFNKHNMREVNHRLHEIKNRKEKLSKQVDMRAMGLLAKKEEEYEELNKKRIIVLRDRATLENTIEDLEKIKNEVLLKAFESINKDLGNIFKTLLPGSFAKLEPVNKNSLLEGVEFKVSFGDVWKESLNELSGGQRSLVALSLILSLLLYKPAPLYILDEVDAALDTSHTQNIGLMIKKYFKHSQFVIVSLKDGMFNNANVLFRTKLVEGVSTIQRYEQKKKPLEKNSRAMN